MWSKCKHKLLCLSEHCSSCRSRLLGLQNILHIVSCKWGFGVFFLFEPGFLLNTFYVVKNFFLFAWHASVTSVVCPILLKFLSFFWSDKRDALRSLDSSLNKIRIISISLFCKIRMDSCHLYSVLWGPLYSNCTKYDDARDTG